MNLTLAWKEEDLRAQFGGTADYIRPSALKGSAQQMVDRIGEYADAGAERVILALRAPFDVDGLDRFAAEVLPTRPDAGSGSADLDLLARAGPRQPDR